MGKELPGSGPWASSIVLKELNVIGPPTYGMLGDLRVFKTATFGLDFALGYAFQLYLDSQDPYLNSGGRQIRAVISGGGGAASSAIAATVAIELGLCPETGGLTCLAVAGTVGGLIWSSFQDPLLYWLEPRVSPYGFHVIPVRNLRALKE